MSLTLSGNPSQASTFSKEVECLAKNIYFEARGEPVKGQIAVALVTLNRVKDKRFPKTICEVIYDGCQFSWICDNKSDVLPNNKQTLFIKTLAKSVLINNIPDFTNGALYFSNKAIKRKKGVKTLAIGSHIFYRRI